VLDAAAGKNMGRQAMGEDWIFGCHAMESVAAPAVRGDPSSPEPNTGAHNVHVGALPAASGCAAREGMEKGRAAPALLAMPCDGRRRHDVWLKQARSWSNMVMLQGVKFLKRIFLYLKY